MVWRFVDGEDNEEGEEIVEVEAADEDATLRPVTLEPSCPLQPPPRNECHTHTSSLPSSRRRLRVLTVPLRMALMQTIVIPKETTPCRPFENEVDALKVGG